jgi:hypothetical protein
VRCCGPTHVPYIWQADDLRETHPSLGSLPKKKPREHSDCLRKFIDSFCESVAPPVDTTLHVKVASEHSRSRRSKWLEVVNWPSCLGSRFAHIVSEGQQTRLPKKKCHWRCVICGRNFVALEVIPVVYVRTNLTSPKKTRIYMYDVSFSAGCCSEVRWQSRNPSSSQASKKRVCGPCCCSLGYGIGGYASMSHMAICTGYVTLS